jgi:hypothetical protein
VHEWLNPDSPLFNKTLSDAVFHYSPRINRDERIEVCIATSEMNKASWKYAHRSQILLDGTFGICNKKMLLFIVMGVDTANRGIPLAFFLFSAPSGNQKTSAGYDTNVLERMLRKWQESLGTHNDEALDVFVAITDTDLAERGALLRVFPKILLLICKFHLRQSWKNYRARSLRGVTSDPAGFRDRLHRLEDRLVETEAFKVAQDLVANEKNIVSELRLSGACGDADADGAVKHLEYLDTYWLRESLWQSWSKAGRLQAAVVLKRPVN